MVKIKPIDYPIVAAVHTPMYLMHKYWARKPHNVVAAYIENFSEKNEIVLDPFCGSGVTPVEAARLGRIAIGVDIDPMSILITRITGARLSTENIHQRFRSIKAACEKRINDLYRAKCPTCGERALVVRAAWQRKQNEPIGNERLVRTKLLCKKCNSNTWNLAPAAEDAEKANRPEDDGALDLIPDSRLVHNSRINVHQGMCLKDLFVHRALVGLSILLQEINETEPPLLRQTFQCAFTSAIAQVSKLHSIDFRSGREWQSRGWTVRGYWIPIGFFEDNVWSAFEARVKKLLRGKIESNQLIAKWEETADFEKLRSKKNVMLINGSCLDMSNLKNESIDYVFTDPPYGDYVPYLELHQIWNLWLKHSPDFSSEVIISNSPEREKGFEKYREDLAAAFKEIYRVLKPGRWMTVTFHNQKISVWNALNNAAKSAGFVYINDVYELPAVVSSRAQLAPSTSLTGDIIINFRKPVSSSEFHIALGSPEEAILSEAQQIIAERGGQATNNQVKRGVVHRLFIQGLMNITTEEIDDVLSRNFRWLRRGDWTFLEAEEPEPSTIIDYIPLSKRVEWIVTGALAEGSKELSEVLVRVFRLLKNGRTPETADILDVLRRIAVLRKRKWVLREDLATQLELALADEVGAPPTPLGEEEILAPGDEHNYFIKQIANLGLKENFNVWIGKNEQNRNKELRSLSLPSLDIPGFNGRALATAEQIDVIWLLRRQQPIALFEVENKTAFTKGIRKMNDLCTLVPFLSVQSFVVTPDYREGQVVSELLAPSIAQSVQQENWGYILYSDFLGLLDYAQSGKTIALEDLLSIRKAPFSAID